MAIENEIAQKEVDLYHGIVSAFKFFLLFFSLDSAMVDRSKKKFGQAGKVYVAGVKIIQDDEGMWDEFVELMKEGGNVVSSNKKIR